MKASSTVENAVHASSSCVTGRRPRPLEILERERRRRREPLGAFEEVLASCILSSDLVGKGDPSARGEDPHDRRAHAQCPSRLLGRHFDQVGEDEGGTLPGGECSERSDHLIAVLDRIGGLGLLHHANEPTERQL
jgi:hypothetical protein